MVLYSDQRKFSHTKFILLLVTILNLEIQYKFTVYQDHFAYDLKFCPRCFKTQVKNCLNTFEKLEYSSDNESPLINFINLLPKSSKRETHLVKFQNDPTKIIGKYLASRNQLNTLDKNFDVLYLVRVFVGAERLDGLQYCPSTSIQRFVAFFMLQAINRDNGNNELTIWVYMLVNSQPLLLPYLHSQGFPVPKTYDSCGFTIFQEHVGTSLIHFYDADFKVKLEIARQLLEGALKFTRGFQGFRMYITDLNADNIVYNETLQRLYFVDLDTVFIVDGKYVSAVAANTLKGSEIHKHEYIECNDCFAYSPEEICAYHLSDLNLFAACQFLREDLKKDRTKGFLYPIPNYIKRVYPYLGALLDVCVDCVGEGCNNRFAATVDLITIIEKILMYL